MSPLLLSLLGINLVQFAILLTLMRIAKALEKKG